MRPSGVLDEDDTLRHADHVCWVYDEPASFVEAAHRFLAEGLARSDRLLCVGDGLAEGLLAAGEPFGGLSELVDRGALGFAPVSSTYADGRVVVPGEQLAFYDEAVRAAQRAGYRGLRVVAEVSPLAATRAGRAELVRWEHLADEYIASGAGMVALCGYSRPALDTEAVADVAAVHPSVHAPSDPPSFRIWFDGASAALAGTVDTFAADRLARILAGSPLTGPEVVLDLAGLEAVDAAGSRVLARWAGALAARGTTVRFPGAPRSLVRIWALLDLGQRAPVDFAEPA